MFLQLKNLIESKYLTGGRFLGSEGQTSNFSAWVGTPTQQTSDLKAWASAPASDWLMPALLASDWPRLAGAESLMWRDSPEILTRLETGPQWGHRQWFRWEESSNHRNGKLNFPRLISQSWKHDRKLSVLIFLRPALERKISSNIVLDSKNCKCFESKRPLLWVNQTIIARTCHRICKALQTMKRNKVRWIILLKAIFPQSNTAIFKGYTNNYKTMEHLALFLFLPL